MKIRVLTLGLGLLGLFVIIPAGVAISVLGQSEETAIAGLLLFGEGFVFAAVGVISARFFRRERQDSTF